MRQLNLIVFLMLMLSCKDEQPKLLVEKTEKPLCRIDSVDISEFFIENPLLANHHADVVEFYSSRTACVWFDQGKPIDYAHVLFDRLKTIADEGLPDDVPYMDKLESIFDVNGKNRENANSELLLSALYFYYTCNVYGGLDAAKSRETGWFLPRSKISYAAHLDTLLKKKEKGDPEYFDQYYNLKKALRKYRAIENSGGWGKISLPGNKITIAPGDTSLIVPEVRKRLFLEGFSISDTQSSIFDKELQNAIGRFNELNVRNPDTVITSKLISRLNVPVSERIRTISLNMERCRWIDPKLGKEKQYIAVNIPSFRLHYFRDGKPFFISRVVVGKEVTETVVFSGEISYLAFAPYWNVPKSIVRNEVLPAIEKDANYLRKHNMEWNGDLLRQKPGKNNALGLVKFMFPNSNNIYLHDTPAKSLFNSEGRAFSHGCIRVERARELAFEITSYDGGWTMEKVDRAMNQEKESTYSLSSKIPVYIAYFTAWADEQGNCAFFDDVYKRDKRLSEMLYSKNVK